MKTNIQLIVLFIFFISCSDDISSTSSENTPPLINEIVLTPSDPKINQVVRVKAYVHDADNDKLDFNWLSTAGAFVNNGRGNPIYWSTPNARMNCIITCQVWDGYNLVSKSLPVYVQDESNLLPE
ncbi:hypothetical protein ACFL3O_01140 [Candidatus Neomarinimicrobiota bacterium]